MIKDTFRLNHRNYTRIGKIEARKRFNSGEPILFEPCIISRPSEYFSFIPFDNENGTQDFDKLVNAFEYYGQTPYAIFYKIQED